MTTLMKTRKVGVLIAGLALASAIEARGQTAETPSVFLGANLAGQAHSHTFSTSESFPVYNETATVASSQGVSGGVIFDVSGGVRVNQNFGVSAGLTRYSEAGSATMIASVPNPLLFDRFATVTKQVDNLDRTELGIHFSAVVFLPVPDFLPDDAQIKLLVGPSFFNVDQSLVNSAIIPAGTQDAVPRIVSESKTGVGFNAGFDLTYPVAPRVGIGAFIRYAGATVDLPSAADMKAGGMQMGAGIRLNF